MEIFGTLERALANLYPYRVPIGALALLALAGAAWLAYRRGLHRVVARRPMASAIVVLPLLAIVLPLGYYLLSPLWTRTHLEEASPLLLAGAQTTGQPSAAQPTPTPEPAASPTAGDRSTATPVPEPTLEPTATPEPNSANVPEAQDEPAPEPTAEPAVEPEPTAEPEPVEFVPAVVRSGSFHGADDFHFGSGSALIIETSPGVYVLRFENFSVQNGPDLYVYLSTSPDGYGEGSYNLGQLKATDGSFNYDIPPGVDPWAYGSVIIWCEPFAVLFATAPLV